MTPEQFYQQMNQKISDIPNQVAAVAGGAAGNSIVRQIDKRVRGKQTKADGSLWGTYSPSYAKYREKRGYSNSNKSFEMEGAMWLGFGVQSTSGDRNNITVDIGGRNSDSQNKIKWNSEREGENITTPSSEELSKFAKTLSREIIKFMST